MPAPKGHPKWGGRPKGRKNEKTLDLLWERELQRRQILAERGALTQAQMDHAKGVYYMLIRRPDGTYSRATDEKQINAAIAIGGEALKVFTQAPNPQAYATLMAYALDKPKEQAQELTIKADVNVTDILRQRMQRRKKAE